MATLDELELPFLPMEEATFANDPFTHMARARQQHPWLAKCSFGYVVHGHQSIHELLLKDDKLDPSFDDVVEIMGGQGTEWGRFQHSHLLQLSGAAHDRLRNILAPLFTPGAANRNRSIMCDTMIRVLDEWAPKQEMDFEEFVSHFPITVMCALIGADPAVIPHLRSSLEALGLAFGMNPELMPRVEQSHLVMDEFVQGLVAERRATPRTAQTADLLDTLIGVTGGDGLTERELYDLLIFLFVAGYDTSKNVLTLIMHLLLKHPDAYERCAVDLEFCRKVVHEGMRLHSPATITRRVGTEFVYKDVAFPKGALLFFTVNVSGRDPASFNDPDSFVPDRDPNQRHAAFGRGHHICLGQHIAKAQIEEGLHLIAQRIKNPRQVGPVGYRTFFGVWGLRGLPITFEDSGSPSLQAV